MLVLMAVLATTASAIIRYSPEPCMITVKQLLTTGFALLATTMPCHAEKPPATSVYRHLYTDTNGVSHIREEKLDFQSMEGGLLLHQLDIHGPAMMLKLPVGTAEDWHNAPMKLYLVVMQGAVEVTSSDGMTQTLKVGDIILLDDLTGKGHKTRAVGKVDHIAMGLPAAEATTSPATNP